MQLKISQIAKAYVAKRLFGYGPVDNYSAVDNFQGPVKDIKLLGLYSGVAYRCINTLAEATAGQYEPYPYSLDSQGKSVVINNHPFWQVLNSPNSDMTYYQLVEGMASFVEQFGEFFLYMVPGAISGYSQGVKEIYLLRPDKMGIVLDKKTGEVIGYKYAAGTANQSIPFTPEEIKHYMTFNPRNPYRGYSTVEAAIDYIQTEEEVSRFTRNYFRNNAAMSGILSVEGKLTRDNWNKFVRQWRERYQGVDNAGKVALVRDSQVKFTPVTSSISDMQLKDLKETTVDQILMMFRIPKGLFGMESDQGLGRASVETLEYIFAKWTIDNKLDRFDDFIEGILKSYYPKLAYPIAHKNIIPEDKTYKLDYYNQGVDRWITAEEIRDADPELQSNKVKGANQLIRPVMVQSMSDIGTETAEPTSSTSSAKVTLVKSKKKDLNYKTHQKEAFRLAIEKNSVAYARHYRKAFNKVLKKQKETVLNNLTHLRGKGLADDLLSMSEEDQNFSDGLTPVLQSLILEQGQLAMEFSGSDQKYQQSKALENAIKASTKKMSQNFDQATLDELNNSLNEGLQNSESIDELSARVSSIYDDAEGYRSDRVARTEAQSASNGATLDAYQQNPVVVSMTWFANPGACPYCEELDGTTVGTEEIFVAQGDSVDVTADDGSTDSFQADYGDIETPPLHPNCSCTIIPEVDGGGDSGMSDNSDEGDG